MGEKLSKLWPIFEAIDTDPKNLYETLQSVRETRINDLKDSKNLEAINHNMAVIHDISVALLDLEQELHRMAIPVLRYE